MITRLRIDGFQSLTGVDIELGRLTAVVGASNSGKSALRRALWALATNAPATGFLRTGSASMAVRITLDDGAGIEWSKGTKATTYTVRENIGALNASQLVIDKPGATVPPAVLEVLRLSEVNFAGQFDLPYLLADTPSAAAKALGDLTNLTVLIEGVREAERRRRQADKESTTLRGLADEAAEAVEHYHDLPNQAEHLHSMSTHLGLANEAVRHYAEYGVRLSECRRLTAFVDAAESSLADIHMPTESAMAQAEQATARAVQLTASLTIADDARNAIESAVLVLSAPEPPPLPDVAVETASTLARALEATKRHYLAFMDATTAEQQAETQLLGVDQAIAAIPTCPTCGQPIGVPA